MPTFENTHRNGFAFGGFGDLDLSDNVSLLTELQFSAEGGKDELKSRLFQLPILLKLELADKFSFWSRSSS